MLGMSESGRICSHRSPIAFGGIVGMKAPATGTRTVSIKIGTALRSSINMTLP